MLENIIGVEEAAEILELSPGTVKNMCAEGKLYSKKVGKTWILDKTNLEVIKMENLKIKGLEKARREFNNWQGHAAIMVDFSDMTAWCDVFASSQEWTEYHSDDVVKVYKKASISIHERDKQIKRGQLNEIVAMLFEGYQKGHRSTELNDFGRYPRDDR